MIDDLKAYNQFFDAGYPSDFMESILGSSNMNEINGVEEVDGNITADELTELFLDDSNYDEDDEMLPTIKAAVEAGGTIEDIVLAYGLTNM